MMQSNINTQQKVHESSKHEHNLVLAWPVIFSSGRQLSQFGPSGFNNQNVRQIPIYTKVQKKLPNVEWFGGHHFGV